VTTFLIFIPACGGAVDGMGKAMGLSADTRELLVVAAGCMTSA
jgi:hypothetical protein